MYWNPGTTGHDASLPLAEPHLGLSAIKTSLLDGFFSCTFLREVSVEVLRKGFDVFLFPVFDNRNTSVARRKQGF